MSGVFLVAHDSDAAKADRPGPEGPDACGKGAGFQSEFLEMGEAPPPHDWRHAAQTAGGEAGTQSAAAAAPGRVPERRAGVPQDI
jgi:hypothetical protein